MRTITTVLQGQQAEDGGGVKLTRFFDPRSAKLADPFLLLDEFRTDEPLDYVGGFPPHPHRGFETVTYMIEGAMRHADNHGNTGRLESGGAQWMTAGRGIIHEEMPQQENGLLWGYQLWVNLPAARKMADPFYRDLRPEDIPSTELEGGVRARVIAGELAGVRGPIAGGEVDPSYFDIEIPAGGQFTWQPAEGHLILIVGVSGEVSVQGAEVASRQLAIAEGEGPVEIGSGAGGRVLVIAGRPLREPVAHAGPFVMNTRQQLLEAVNDYQAGRF